MNGYDLIVKDSEFDTVRSELTAMLANLENTAGQYGAILDATAAGAIPSGDVHDALVAFRGYVTELEAVCNGMSSEAERVFKGYLSDLEAADSYLYDAGVSSIARDFSDEQYEYLCRCVKENWLERLEDPLDDWGVAVVMKVLTFFWKGAKERLQRCHSILLDQHDETKQGLKTMFEAVYAVDARYSGAGAMVMLLEVIRKMLAAVRQMSALIRPGSGQFTVSNIDARLGGLFSGMLADYAKLIAIPVGGEAPSITQIAAFASSFIAVSFFSAYLGVISEFIGSVDGWDAAGMVLFNMFDIGEGTILHGDYADYQRKRMLLELLEKKAKDNLYKESGADEQLDDAKLFLKYYKKYGDGLYDYLNEHRLENGKLMLDGRTVEAKEFNRFLDALGNTKDILKYGEKGVDFLARYLSDYSESAEYLDSLERNFSGSPEMLEDLHEMQALFKKEGSAWLQEAWESNADIAVDIAKKGAKALGGKAILKVVGGVETGINVFGTVTGLGEDAAGTYEALVRFDLYSESNTAYQNALEKFLAADPASEDYEALGTDLRNCFDLCKSNTVELFKAMAKGSSGDKAAYYNYLARHAESRSMFDTAAPDFLSYEDFLAAA